MSNTVIAPAGAEIISTTIVDNGGTPFLRVDPITNTRNINTKATVIRSPSNGGVVYQQQIASAAARSATKISVNAGATAFNMAGFSPLDNPMLSSYEKNAPAQLFAKDYPLSPSTLTWEASQAVGTAGNAVSDAVGSISDSVSGVIQGISDQISGVSSTISDLEALPEKIEKGAIIGAALIGLYMVMKK